jgi:ethanolamine ammonia-lyase small subunit
MTPSAKLPQSLSRSISSIDTLRMHTPARVALARAGSAIATQPQLQFQLDHALARDAVHARLDVPGLIAALTAMRLDAIPLRSAIPSGPDERRAYLRRPDLGRRLSPESAASLRPAKPVPDLVFAIADGLSALAIERHALPLLEATLPLLADWRIGPVCVVQQGRVAIGDEIGELLSARALVMLIGERPGLSAADSLGVYLTWNPRAGRTDAERNCISNIRQEGLSYADAAQRVLTILIGARNLGSSGVNLRETFGLL